MPEEHPHKQWARTLLTLSAICLISLYLAESFHSIVGYFQMSEQAQQEAETSVQGPQSPVGQAKRTQESTVELLRRRGDTFRRSAAAHRKSLRDLKKKVNSLHLRRINQKAGSVAGLGEGRARKRRELIGHVLGSRLDLTLDLSAGPSFLFCLAPDMRWFWRREL